MKTLNPQTSLWTSLRTQVGGKNVFNNSLNPTGINCVNIHTCIIRDDTSCVILTRHPTWHVFPVNVHITVHCGYSGSICRSSSCCMLQGNHTLKLNSTWAHLYLFWALLSWCFSDIYYETIMLYHMVVTTGFCLKMQIMSNKETFGSE